MGSETQWSLVELVETLNNTAATDKDNLIGVDGLTGSGKSTLAIKACKAGCSWFDMNKDILYSREEIIEWVTTAKPGSWGVADEIINALFKRDFANRNQKFILKIFDMCRDRNLTLFMCIPNFWAIDKHLLEGRLRLRIHIGRTGLAFLWRPSGNPFAPDRWYRKYNEKVCYNWDTYPNAKRTKGFTGYLKFGDLGVKEKELYLKIKAEKKKIMKQIEELKEEEEHSSKVRSVALGRTLLLNELLEDGLLRQGWQVGLAKREGVTPTAIRNRLKNLKEKQSQVESEPNKQNLHNSYNSSNKKDDFMDKLKEITS